MQKVIHDLKGFALLWATATSEGKPFEYRSGVIELLTTPTRKGRNKIVIFNPLTDNNYILQLISREKISLSWGGGHWEASPNHQHFTEERLPIFYGNTPHEAVLHCFVGTCLGDVITLPEDYDWQQ